MSLLGMTSGQVALIEALLPLAGASWLVFTRKRTKAVKIDWSDLDLSTDSVEVLDALLTKEAKYQRARAKNETATFVMGISALLFLFSFYWKVLVQSKGRVIDMLDGLTNNEFVLVSLVLLISSLIYGSTAKKNMDKEKSEYKALRNELIDRFLSNWIRSYSSSTRDIISQRLFDQAEINLRYKND